MDEQLRMALEAHALSRGNEVTLDHLLMWAQAVDAQLDTQSPSTGTPEAAGVDMGELCSLCQRSRWRHGADTHLFKPARLASSPTPAREEGERLDCGHTWVIARWDSNEGTCKDCGQPVVSDDSRHWELAPSPSPAEEQGECEHRWLAAPVTKGRWVEMQEQPFQRAAWCKRCGVLSLSGVLRYPARQQVRKDYLLWCGDCGGSHFLDTSLPSEIWNQIADPSEVLCPLCIDARLKAKGLTAEAEFYYAGDALRSKLYRPVEKEQAHAGE